MVQSRHWLSALSCSLAISVVSIAANTTSAYAVSLVNNLTIPGNSTDLSPLNGGMGGANVNRLALFSDLYYDRYQNVYYSLPDRGPGGGVISYNTRIQKFSLDVDPNTGAISNFKLLDTILFTKNGKNFNGLNPSLLNSDAGVLGLSFDPEGFAVAPNGNFYVSDEYGPSVYEFSSDGSFIRAFKTPENIIPKVGSSSNYVDGQGTITSGRQDNRGFEGLTLSPDGTKLYAILQDALVNEGSNEGSADGRYSRNVRLVEFNTATGESVAQYIYQLETIADINERIPGTKDDFKKNAQGRNIGVSAITALNDKEFLVLERDNRGLGVEDTASSKPVGSKRVYKINLTDATDVSSISLAGSNMLPVSVNAVNKSLFLDIADALADAFKVIPEKFEGLAIGPQLADGSYALLLGTDNDFSVTQNGDDVQFDVCTGGTQVPIDQGCPAGETLIPSFLYSFKASSAELTGFVPPVKPLEKVPEPVSNAGLVLLGLGGFWLKRRQHGSAK
ncbi:esterase-like activity of phytase family protein [Coleofasciculus sp. H7-2]|uniref:esterase-like activity of phytase family protein n=1 Tax=Coleofasciculus sp. H7-2 TaxID=3351545 RepID=UPI00366FA161